MFYVDENNPTIKELLLAKKRFESIFEGNAAGIFVVDENRDIIIANQRFCDIVGFSKKELVGQNACFAHISKESCMKFKENFLKAKKEGLAKIEFFVRKKDCDGIWVEMFGSPIELEENHFGVIWSIIDISERKLAEETIKNLAFYDALTGLANRHLLENRIEMIIENKKREDKFGAILFLDLDNFKILNDTFGHHAGDLFLKEVSSRLLTCLRTVDTIARLGGDEFVIIIDNLHSNKKKAKEEVHIIALKVLELLRAPYIINVNEEDKSSQDIKHNSSASIGVTLFKQENTSCNGLLRRADKAMYNAKKSGKDMIKFDEE